MNKADLTEKLAERADIPKVRAAQYINILVTSIQEALEAGEKVTISDFGTFTISKRRAFKGHNPKSGSPMPVPARRIPMFRAGKGLKEALNAGSEA
jgi:DNA-binding protein HU-beta